MMARSFEAHMTTLSPFLAIHSSCDQALQMTKTQLSEAGLSAVQTFNLNTARLGLHNCCCPNHGTEACDCQMIVLLVYGDVAEPATLILHGNNGQTWISIADSASQPGHSELVTRIRRVLENVVTADL
jgi:hypothetical protein